MGDAHPAGKVVVAELQLLDEPVDCPLQPRHVVLASHAAAVQQVVYVDGELLAAVGMVQYAGDFGRAIIHFDATFRRVEVVQHAPVTGRRGSALRLLCACMSSAAMG